MSSGPRREKTCLRGCVDNKGAYQPVHPPSLISVFVMRLLESIISTLATSECSAFQIVLVADETGLSLTLSESLKTNFVMLRAI